MMTPHNYTRYSWPLAIAALVIIAVSGIAPWLFTQPGRHKQGTGSVDG